MSRELAGIVGVWLTDPMAEFAWIFHRIILPVASVFLLSRLIIYAWMKRTGWRSSVFSPTAASLMIGILLTAAWYFVEFVRTGGNATPYSIFVNIALALLLFWPIVLLLGTIFTSYVFHILRGAYFTSGLSLIAVSTACVAAEYVWFRYLSSG
jgi:hypothetical protein